jgi:hypothetical protein
MTTSTPQPWLPRLLYRGTLALAALLVFLVLFAPLLPLAPEQHPLAKFWHLFAQDDTLRKVAVVGAIGLWTTALVCFRKRCPIFE